MADWQAFSEATQPRIITTAGLDLAGVGAILLHWAGDLPAVVGTTATGLAALWYVLQIIDWFRRRGGGKPPEGPREPLL